MGEAHAVVDRSAEDVREHVERATLTGVQIGHRRLDLQQGGWFA